MSQYTLYTHPFSRGAGVLWMLEECGADYELVPLQYGAQMKSPDYLAINPMGKVPALTAGDLVITEAAAILMYLADSVPEKSLIAPVGSAARGEFYRWMMFTTQAEYAVIDRRCGITLRDEDKVAVGYGSYDDVVATLRAFLTGKRYALGDAFSVLDVYLAGLINFANMVGLMDDEVLSSYAKAHTTRAAYLRSQEVNNDLAQKMGLV